MAVALKVGVGLFTVGVRLAVDVWVTVAVGVTVGVAVVG